MDCFNSDIEVLEFYRPDNCKKCLFVSNLKRSSAKIEGDHKTDSGRENHFGEVAAEKEPWTLQRELEEKFNKFGLLYEVNIVDSVNPTAASADDTVFAFVRFYSERDAATAKKRCSGRLFINGKRPKVSFSVRQNKDPPPLLYLAKCYELANHFLGFNGWTVKILCMSDESNSSEECGVSSASYRCVVQLTFPAYDLHAEGIGVAKENYTKSDASSKLTAVCKAKKNAHREAVRDAFRKVVIVRMPDDRILVEVNTTLEELHHFDEDLNTKDMIRVTELEFDPYHDPDLTENDGMTQQDNTDADEMNKMILQELAEETF